MYWHMDLDKQECLCWISFQSIISWLLQLGLPWQWHGPNTYHHGMYNTFSPAADNNVLGNTVHTICSFLLSKLLYCNRNCDCSDLGETTLMISRAWQLLCWWLSWLLYWLRSRKHRSTGRHDSNGELLQLS